MWVWGVGIVTIVVVVVLKVGVQGSESEWLELFFLSLMRRMKSEECSCGDVAVDLKERGYICFFKSKY